MAKPQALVRIPTVSDRDPERVDSTAFGALLAELRTQFPLLHERLDLTRIGSHRLLFLWPGVASTEHVVLMARMSAVQADERMSHGHLGDAWQSTGHP